MNTIMIELTRGEFLGMVFLLALGSWKLMNLIEIFANFCARKVKEYLTRKYK